MSSTTQYTSIHDKMADEVAIFIRELIKYVEIQTQSFLTRTFYRENGDISFLTFVISNYSGGQKNSYIDRSGFHISGALGELITPCSFANLIANVKRVLDSSNIVIKKGHYAGLRLTIDALNLTRLMHNILTDDVTCVFTMPTKSITYEDIIQ